MHLNSHTPGRRSRVAAGLAVAVLATTGAVGLLSSCGQPPRSPAGAAAALTPGPGLQRTAGMPGASTRSGTSAMPGASAVPGASTMPGMSMSMDPAGAGRAATAAPVAANTVAIRNFAFSPATLKVRAGTKVTWTNQDTEAHTVTSTGPRGPLHSAALTTRATYSYTFTRPGTYAYLCTIHPFMTATVEVTR
ncbi:cupredoxin family copper-binding protein [Streptomyces fuscichromogenes]|uniref:cupredoxin domain-containing protein n=1 Tax=Streptomyces fuscichromogenes TaxID=1324013 RepID=UPI0038221B8F